MNNNKYCYVILETQKDEIGYIPSIVYENTKGHFPLTGKGEFAEPWHWGETFKIANEIADRKNLELDISKKESCRIICQSMF